MVAGMNFKKVRCKMENLFNQMVESFQFEKSLYNMRNNPEATKEECFQFEAFFLLADADEVAAVLAVMKPMLKASQSREYAESAEKLLANNANLATINPSKTGKVAKYVDPGDTADPEWELENHAAAFRGLCSQAASWEILEESNKKLKAVLLSLSADYALPVN